MTNNSIRNDNKWNYFFSAILTIGLAMNAYIVNKVDAMDARQNEYIERIKGVEIKQDYQEIRLIKLEAILTENKYKFKNK